MKISDISKDYKMATYYPSTSAQIDVLSAPYVRDQKFTSYSEPPPLLHGTMMMYLNPASSTGSFTDVSPGSSMNPQNEMMFIPPTGDSMCVQTMNGAINPEIGQSIGDDDQQSLQGLSLSLRTQMSSAVSSASFQYQYSNPGLSSVLSPHLPLSAENGVRPMGCKIYEVSPSSKELRNSDYFPYDMDGDGPNTIRFGEGNNNEQYEMNIKVMNMNQYQYEQDGIASTIMKSKYLKAAQQLLDEVVNVRDSLKRSESNKDKNGAKAEEGGSQPASETNKSTAGSGSSHELSPTERQELQGKLDKLHSMLDEVDRRYKQYCQQMQIIVSSFDMVVGNGASKPYTALALKTISRHFRCLRDAIVGQIQSRRKSLGEQDNGLGAIPRLRYVDQQLRQQRSLHQFGMMRHAWRPQRGLPENAVTILRAWLFEHFLHPYPKDSEKIMLARQTGLTRSQVGNWFINARVRLWKPMVEEMYKEEFGEEKIKTRSPEHTPKFSREKSWGSEDRRDQEMHETTTSMTTNQDVHDSSNTNPNPGLDTKGFTSSSTPPGFQIGLFTDSENHGFYPNPSISHDPDGGAHLMVPYQIPELGNFNVDNTTQVSLALGLRHREGESNTTMGVGTSEFSYIEQVNQHILNDFVA